MNTVLPQANEYKHVKFSWHISGLKNITKLLNEDPEHF